MSLPNTMNFVDHGTGGGPEVLTPSTCATPTPKAALEPKWPRAAVNNNGSGVAAAVGQRDHTISLMTAVPLAIFRQRRR